MVASIKPTVNDIARHAGVSLATVDRVLNARPGVRTVTIDRVHKSVTELGYVRDTAAANLARGRIFKFTFLLPDNNSEFIDALQLQIEAQSAALSNERTYLQTQRVAAFDSHPIVVALDEIDQHTTDGVAVIGPETPAVRDAIGRARARGIIIVALLSDLPSSERNHFVGIDNTSAGQTAAQLMGRFINAKSGNILFLTNSRLTRNHLERRHGFDTVIADQFPQYKVLPSIEARDDAQMLEQSLPNAFAAWPQIKGIYASVSNYQGLIQYLDSENTKPVIIAHELTPLSCDALQSGLFDALISQDLGHIIRSAVRLMRATIEAVPFNAQQEQMSIDIYLKENLPTKTESNKHTSLEETL